MFVITEGMQTAIRKTAERLSREWPGVEADDIEQEMLAKVLENKDNIAMSVEKSEQFSVTMGLARRRGIEYCSRERYQWQTETAEYIYTPREVRALLAENFFEVDGWLDAPKRPQLEATITGDGICVALMDIAMAYGQLFEAETVLVIRAFRNHETLDRTDRRRLDRVIDRMTRLLNQSVMRGSNDHEGPGARKATTNAQAQAVTADNY